MSLQLVTVDLHFGGQHALIVYCKDQQLALANQSEEPKLAELTVDLRLWFKH